MLHCPTENRSTRPLSQQAKSIIPGFVPKGRRGGGQPEADRSRVTSLLGPIQRAADVSFSGAVSSAQYSHHGFGQRNQYDERQLVIGGNQDYTMPRYFFHVRDADGLSLDTEGAVLSSDEGAFIEAVQAAREMLAEKILKNEVVDGAEFEVVRSDGVLVAKIPLKSVVRFE